MTGTNHTLTGVLIAATVHPVLVIPLAFTSHFLLDALPHFGESYENRRSLSKMVWSVDISLVLAGFTYLILTGQPFILVVGGIAAMSPDFAWIYRFTVLESMGKLPEPPKSRFNELHAGIQKYESVSGIYLELAVFPILLYLVSINI